MTWYGNEPAIEFTTIEAVKSYIQGLNYHNWRPSNFVVHNTASPTLYQWWHSVPPEQRMENLQSYYENDMGWSSGPHFFIDGKSWWCMTPPNVKGVHSPSWNGTMLGFEHVGDYDTESVSSGMGLKVQEMGHALSAVCCEFFGWDPERLKFHYEDPNTTHACPGKNMKKPNYISSVQEYMGSGGGDHDKPMEPWQGTVAGLSDGDKLNIRAQPSSSATAIGAADNGDVLKVISDAWNGSTRWLRVQFGDDASTGVAIYGWTSAAYVTGEPSPTPPEPTPPPDPDDPYAIPVGDRETVSQGDAGKDVEDLQWMLNWTELKPGLDEDGDFGGATKDAVMNYQASRGLDYDGICGPQTWESLYAKQAPLPLPPHALSAADIAAICNIANSSDIRQYSWRDRGIAPVGYTQGMACAFAQSYKKWKVGHPAVVEMAKARTNSDKDALNVYRSNYESLGMSNEQSGADTLRHLYALMLGSGMRESSGRYCEGRDQSATNTSSDTAEAGLFQTSYNAHSASDPEFNNLMTEYSNPTNKATCYTTTFDDGVSCTSSEWDCYGSGQGYNFQSLCKSCPAFAVETHALTLRNLCNHYGPIIRKEVELRKDADHMFNDVQAYIDGVVA